MIANTPTSNNYGLHNLSDKKLIKEFAWKIETVAGAQAQGVEIPPTIFEELWIYQSESDRRMQINEDRCRFLSIYSLLADIMICLHVNSLEDIFSGLSLGHEKLPDRIVMNPQNPHLSEIHFYASNDHLLFVFELASALPIENACKIFADAGTSLNRKNGFKSKFSSSIREGQISLVLDAIDGKAFCSKIELTI